MSKTTSPLNKGAFKELAIEMEENKDRMGREANMKDVFKSMGVRVANDPQLIDDGGFYVRVGQHADMNQAVRKGMGTNARDMLEGHLAKGEASDSIFVSLAPNPKMTPKRKVQQELKGSHGEEFHKDNDKKMEEHQTTVEEIEYKSLTEDEIFLKALSDIQPKSQARTQTKTINKGSIEELVDSVIQFAPDSMDPEVIANVHENSDDRKQVQKGGPGSGPHTQGGGMKPKPSAPPGGYKMQEKRPMGMEGVMKRPTKYVDIKSDLAEAKCMDGVEKAAVKPMKPGAKAKISPDPVALKQQRDEKKKLGIKKSELDEMFDLIKGKKKHDFDGDGKLDPHEKHHKELEHEVEEAEEMMEKPKAKKSFGKFVKSVGQGGIVMDFGHLTGNPMADNATALLNRHADPQQLEIVKYQQRSIAEAQDAFVKKGEQKFHEDRGEQGMFGEVASAWNKQLGKSMDEQVVEAFKKGQLGKGEENPLLRGKDTREAPFITEARKEISKGDFSGVTAQVGGEMVSAQSPTDAAVLEMYKGMMAQQNNADGGFIADTGKISITAGDPLPPELAQ